MKKRTYTGEANLKLLQGSMPPPLPKLTTVVISTPGDIPHHIYNGNKHYDRVEL